MKKLLFLSLFVIALGCSKDRPAEIIDVTHYDWPLQSATVNPAMMVNGKAETDFMRMAGPSACLNSNYVLKFYADSTFAFTSNGALCDMISYQNAKWTKKGNDIFLNPGVVNIQLYKLNGKEITNNYTFKQNDVDYTLTYIFVAKEK